MVGFDSAAEPTDGASPGGEPPALAVWRRICFELDALDGLALTAALARIERRVAGWPDRLRPAPGRWLRDLLDGRAQPRLAAARAVDLTLHATSVGGDRLAWTDSPLLVGVTQLRVFDDELGDAGVERLTRDSTHYPRLVDLALAAGISGAGARRLAGDPRLAGLTSLALFRNAIGPDGLAALIGGPGLGPGLRRLLLGRNALGGAGAEALARPTAIAGLELLDLDCDRLDGPAVRMLTRAPLLTGVRALNLSNNPIGGEGCRALADCPALAGLEVLFLHDCGLDDDAVAPLLRAPQLGRLRNLALSENRLSLATVRELAAQPRLQLHELDICHNPFAAAPAEALLRAAPQLGGLTRLCL